MGTISRIRALLLAHFGIHLALLAYASHYSSYFDFDITSAVRPSPQPNVLLVSVTQPNDPIFPPNNNATVRCDSHCRFELIRKRTLRLLLLTGLHTRLTTAWYGEIIFPSGVLPGEFLLLFAEDRRKGIWRDVVISMVGGVTVRYPAVTSTLSDVRINVVIAAHY